MVVTFIESGLRWGELVALKPRHIDFLRRTLTVEETIVEVSRRHSPTGQRYLTKPYPVDNEPRTFAIARRGSTTSLGTSATAASRATPYCSRPGWARRSAATRSGRGCGYPLWRRAPSLPVNWALKSAGDSKSRPGMKEVSKNPWRRSTRPSASGS